MYSDISGEKPELINVLELIAGGLLATAAIVVGALAITTTLITLPLLVSTLLICGGVSVIADLVVIGKSQYNDSFENNRSRSEINDDVINAIGSLSLDRVFYQTGTKTMVQIGLEGATGLVNIFTLSTVKSATMTIGRNTSIVPTIAVVMTSMKVYTSYIAFFNDDYCFDKASKMGWESWTD